ncbi:helix-turn-helix transcriptional regulator [Pseudomonas cedrina]
MYHRIAANNFPKKIRLGQKCSVWVEDEIYGWMNDRIESREVAA